MEKGIHERYSSLPNDHDLRICFKPRKYLALWFLPAIYILNKCKHTAVILTTNLGGVGSRRLLILKTCPQFRHLLLRKGFRQSGWVLTAASRCLRVFSTSSTTKTTSSLLMMLLAGLSLPSLLRG